MIGSRDFWQGVALVALVLPASYALTAAPVPPAPKELSAEILPGKWDYRWGSHLNGTMWLHADGSYAAVHGPDYPAVCTGTWKVEGWALVLTEVVYCPATGSLHGPANYRVECDPKALPNVRGTWSGVPVELSNPKR